ncbi:MAG: hypothetical protein QOH15_1179, partial [Gaiellales bacterium]|nr:hypothetical protein [Gaiellales bacterium]
MSADPVTHAPPGASPYEGRRMSGAEAVIRSLEA